MKKLTLFFLCSFLILHADNLIKPIPNDFTTETDKVMLGKKLFLDPRLSQDNTISCASCHDLNYGGADSVAFSFGVDGRTGTINSPTVFNAVYNIAQFWDGRAKDLKEQVISPITNHNEMASNEQEIITKLLKDPYYVKKFHKLYKDGITLQNISDAIAAFEQRLITPNARFDLFLKGNTAVLSTDEKDGYALFKNLGCIACHNGVNIGSNMFQKFGVFAEHNTSDTNLGRYNVTHNERDKYYFKVPTLRNIEKTAPYFHDGSAATLEDAVKKMGYYQLGQKLSNEEVKKLTQFLKTLNGDTPNIVFKEEQ